MLKYLIGTIVFVHKFVINAQKIKIKFVYYFAIKSPVQNRI